MVDYLSLALSHGALMLAFWRLMLRDDLDREPPREAESDKPEADEKPPKERLRRA